MPAPENRFKSAIHAGKPQIGLWLDMGEAITAEIAGTSGFDWLVIDGEHGPNDLRSIIDQLRALATSPAEPVVRVPVGESWMIKQLLDAGARTLLVPMVDCAEQAEELVRATRYPPAGVRGVGAAPRRSCPQPRASKRRIASAVPSSIQRVAIAAVSGEAMRLAARRAAAKGQPERASGATT